LVFADDKKNEIASLDDAKTVDEITTYVSQSNNKRPTQKLTNRDDVIKFIRNRGEVSVAGGEKILKIAADDAERSKGLKLKISGLKQIIQADNIYKEKTTESENQTKLNNLIDELEKEGRFPEIVNSERFGQFLLELNGLRTNFNIDKFNESTKKAKKWSVTRPGNFQPVTAFTRLIDIAASKGGVESDPQLVEKTIKDFIAFVNSDEFTLPETDKKTVLESLEGYSLRQIGSNPKIYGKTLNDDNFDWDKLRGKYVLVKFTASWCGPCKGEIPGMISAYEKYHDKGLEIVSIYIWDKLDATKKIVESENIPWIIISEELTEKAGESLQGKKYAITGVPTMFLVDKDGKIIVNEARGEKLQKKLAEIFGDSETTKTTVVKKQNKVKDKDKDKTEKETKTDVANKTSKTSVPATLIVPKIQQ
jgi:thiol-disulfide isomerase/thioredoxin